MSSPLDERFARYVSRLRYRDLPPEVVHEVKRRTIDSVGCAVSAFHARPARIIRLWITRAHGQPLVRGAALWGTRFKTLPSLAAFYNGSLVRYWDYNDTYLSKEPAHPSDNLAAILAVSEAEARTGADAILALTLAYEIQCRLCDAQSLRAKGWDHVTYGAFSVPLACGKLVGLDSGRLKEALNISVVGNIALRQTRVGEISDWKASAFAHAAMNGVNAAYWAKYGLRGPRHAIDGAMGFERLVSGPLESGGLGRTGAGFKILQTHIKYYPVEYHAQAAVEAALKLRKQVRTLQAITRVDIETYRAAIDIIAGEPEKWHPESRETADHSLPYIAARTLLDGRMTLAQFAPGKICDPEVRRLMKRIRVRENRQMSSDYPEDFRVKITIYQGRTQAREEISLPKGHYKRALTDREVEEKFLTLTGRLLNAGKQKRILNILWHLEKLKNWNRLFNLFT